MKVLKKKIEKREKELREMRMTRREVLHRKLHEEKLLGQRILVFLTTSSILLLSFVSLLGSQASLLMWAISISGVFSSVFLIPHSVLVRIELDALAELLKEPKRSCWGKFFRGTSVCVYLSAFFFAIWVVSIFQIGC